MLLLSFPTFVYIHSPSFSRMVFPLAFSNPPRILSQHHEVTIDNAIHGIEIVIINHPYVEPMLRVIYGPSDIHFRRQVANERTPPLCPCVHLFPHPTILPLILNLLPCLTSPPVSIQPTIFVTFPPHVGSEDRSFPTFTTWNRRGAVIWPEETERDVYSASTGF